MSTISDSRGVEDRTATNVEVVARLWREAFDGGDLSILPELAHHEFTNFGEVVDGPQFLTDLITSQRSAFPDMQFETLQTLAAGDWVITKMRWTGTFQNHFSFIGLTGVEPTGRSFDVNHAHAFRLVDAKVAEHWAVRDDLTMHRQLLGNAAA
ncbi:MAG TPA: ester cyclase [Acidimicrobiales bacterium]|jgi:predicted ester cyclase|nr:ester cyclase [Acidimicrobiales bacterium]